jgi:hypothetical protein
MRVVIMRSIPGGGKSHLIHKWEEKYWQFPQQWVVCSADHYHIINGVYTYKPENAAMAHANCLKRYAEAVTGHGYPEGVQYLFVDNTNSTDLEIAPYYRLAEAYGRPVSIMQIYCPFDVAVGREVHDVPISTIWRMHQNILTEKLPPSWKLDIISYNTIVPLPVY